MTLEEFETDIKETFTSFFIEMQAEKKGELLESLYQKMKLFMIISLYCLENSKEGIEQLEEDKKKNNWLKDWL